VNKAAAEVDRRSIKVYRMRSATEPITRFE
jgi:hypothetical protein